MTEQSDNELVQQVVEGNREAFRLLVERYQRKIYAICYGVLKDHEDAMDASQEVFVKVYNHIDTFNAESTFYTWIYRIACNYSIDLLRKQKRVDRVDFDEGTFGEGKVDAQLLTLPQRLGVDPSEGLRRKELREKMQQALESLSENHRTILILREVEGLSYEEISEVLDVSKGTVMSRLFHARRNFQLAIEPYLSGNESLKDVKK